MFYRILLYAFGILLSAVGVCFCLLYLSFIGSGVDFFSYIVFLLTRKEILFLPIGIFVLCISLFFDAHWHKFILWRKSRRLASRDSM